ncbi:MAG: SCP2 sterol-binding domain-containing protein [Oscillospiraceae bacterium]|nr:SCP2 sterol-binding domain-containing protein [Oscillospiraceae bacterium]
MTNVELVEKIKGYLKGSKTKAKKFEDLVAVNFTLIGYDDDLYIEVKDGVLDVNHYHYDDFQANVSGAPENIDKIFAGEIDMDKAIEEGLVQVTGDVAKFKALAVLIPAKKDAKAPAAKKAAAKAPAAKKAAAKAPAKKAAPAKKEEKPAAKAPAKKADVKAEVKAEPKVEVKAEAKAPAKRCCKSKK